MSSCLGTYVWALSASVCAKCALDWTLKELGSLTLLINSLILIMIHSLNLIMSCKMMGLTFYIEHSITSTLTLFVVLNFRCANPDSLLMTIWLNLKESEILAEMSQEARWEYNVWDVNSIYKAEENSYLSI